MQDLTAIILTYNEEKHIQRAIESVSEIATDIVVVDSFSTDKTVEIARALGARVYQNPFTNQAQQFCWALQNTEISTDWIMRLDADEYIEKDLRNNILDSLPSLDTEITGVVLNRKQIFMGRWIKYGGRYPLLLLRIWRRGKAEIENRWMDEHAVLIDGRAILLKGGFVDNNLNDLSWFIKKHNQYATREAVEVLGRKYKLFDNRIGPAQHASFQAANKRRIKNHLYNKIPFPVAAIAYFLYRYIFQLGVLDGREGLIYHVLQGFWYRFLVGAKVWELDRTIRADRDPAAAKKVLSAAVGHAI